LTINGFYYLKKNKYVNTFSVVDITPMKMFEIK